MAKKKAKAKKKIKPRVKALSAPNALRSGSSTLLFDKAESLHINQLSLDSLPAREADLNRRRSPPQRSKAEVFDINVLVNALRARENSDVVRTVARLLEVEKRPKIKPEIELLLKQMRSQNEENIKSSQEYLKSQSESIEAVSERTGIKAATLRMWRSRNQMLSFKYQNCG